MAITDWPADQRPREKLLAQGAAALSDAELVALFLRTGIAGKNAVELARELIGVCGGLNGLLSADRTALAHVRGLGSAKLAQLAAVLELARRCLGEQLRNGTPLNSPSVVRDYLRLALGSREHEVFLALFVDAQHRVLCAEELFRGTLTQTSVYTCASSR